MACSRFVGYPARLRYSGDWRLRSEVQEVSLHRLKFLGLILPFLLMLAPGPVHACTYSIPVVGRWPNLQIVLQVPQVPRWAHDIVTNASQVWNTAQLWFQRNYFPGSKVYEFIESGSGNVTVSFEIPPEFAAIAVGWTQYVLDATLNILGAHVYLDGAVFNKPSEPNTTTQALAFRLALHELGRVLGLGSLVDGQDIMDPIGTVSHAMFPPIISVIDLFALHELASTSSFSSPITLSTDQQVVLNGWSLLPDPYEMQANPDSGTTSLFCPLAPREPSACYS